MPATPGPRSSRPPPPTRRRSSACIDRLGAGGSTAGAEGIRQAYALAEQNFDPNGVNRVILATDGDFNVGITDQDELKGFVERERGKGVFLSVLGFGMGNYNDALMQTLAQNGNGAAAYIDTINEARKVLVEEATSTLFPIAKDVKIQVEFNPATVAEYRLIGYETRLLNRDDFDNDKVDAGDVGSGQTVTALYEIVPVGGTARRRTTCAMARPRRRAPALDRRRRRIWLRQDPLQAAEVGHQHARSPRRSTAPSSTPASRMRRTMRASRPASRPSARCCAAAATPARSTTTTCCGSPRRRAATIRIGYRSEFLQLVRAAKTASAMQPQRP